MALMIGFGSTEKEFEEAEEKAFREAVREFHADSEATYFTDEVEKQVADWINKRADSFREKADEYKAAENFPPRYSYYYPHVLSDASYIVAAVSFHHINRRHALSPDGWALMATKRLFHMDIDDAA